MTGDFTSLNIFCLDKYKIFLTPNYILYPDGSTFSFSYKAAQLSRLEATNFHRFENVFCRSSRLRKVKTVEGVSYESIYHEKDFSSVFQAATKTNNNQRRRV